MKNTTCFVLILIVCVLSSCSKTKKGSENLKNSKSNPVTLSVKTIKVDTWMENLIVDDYIADLKYIKLETKSNCLIGNVEKLLFNNDKIYVKSDGVFVFDKTGKHLFSIANKGKGPGEFISLYDISISENTLYLYDNDQGKLLCYQADNGQYLKEISVPYSGMELECVNHELFINIGGIPQVVQTEGQLLTCDLNKPEDYKQYYPKGRLDVGVENQLLAYNQACYWIEPFSYKVFKSDKNGMSDYVQFDFGKNNISENQLKVAKTMEDISSLGKANFLSDFYETPAYISAVIYLKEKRYQILYDKLKQKAIACEYFKGEPYQMVLSALGVDGDYFCSYLMGYSGLMVMQKMANEKTIVPKSYQETIDMFKTCQAGDNPIIVQYKVKDMN